MFLPALISPAGMPAAPHYPWQQQLTRTNLDLSNAWTRGILAGITITAVGISFILLAALAMCVRLREVKKTETKDSERFYISDLKEESGLGVSLVEVGCGEKSSAREKACVKDGRKSLETFEHCQNHD